ncbi:MAG: hypothetical protein HKP61_02785 [Dactylosporangium sp.]|nr:hypothetical protein [Dactylosporangium sp.]NNJ59886.1 hypothetical protein [Dactylosporangium sp.]
MGGLVRPWGLTRNATASDPVLLPAAVYQRGYAADPPLALVVTPGEPASRYVPRHRRLDQETSGYDGPSRPRRRQLVRALLGLGLAPVIGPGSTLPRVPGLTAYQVGSQLSVHDMHCDLLLCLALEHAQPWPRAVAAGRRIGLVFALDHDDAATPAGFTAPGRAIGGSLAVESCQRLRRGTASRA